MNTRPCLLGLASVATALASTGALAHADGPPPRPGSAGLALALAPARAQKAKSPAAPAKAGEEKEDADEFEKPETGPVDRRVHISGALATSLRLTWFDSHRLADGTRQEDDHTFEIEHVHLKFSGDLTRSLSWVVQPCVAHMNDFSLIEARLTYSFHRAFQVTAGRFLLPFGQFNLRSLPGLYSTVSRPLLYQSHEDRFISFRQGSPRNFLFTPRDDLGVLFTGSVWLGEEEKWQLSYQAYVTNGLRGASDTLARFWDDNNNGKQYGGRLSLGYFGDRLSFSVGVSGLLNEWEKDRRQFAVGGDAWVGYEVRPGRRINLRGEYVLMRREVLPGPELLQGDEEVSGFYVTVDAMLLSWLGVFAQFDQLRNKVPHPTLNEGFQDVTTTMNRWIAGVLFAPVGALAIRLEYGRWLMPMGLPDAHRLAAQAVLMF